MKLSNIEILNMVKEITIARLSGDSNPTGDKTAEFMQAIYNKLVELNSAD